MRGTVRGTLSNQRSYRDCSKNEIKMNFTIFSKLSVHANTDEEAVLDLKKFQQLASQIRQRYQLLNTVVPLIEDEEEAKNVSFAFTELNQQFNAINQEVNKYTNEKERNLSKALESIKKYDEVFNQVEPIYQAHKDKIMSAYPSVETIMQDVMIEQKQYINSLNAQWSTLQNNLTEKIEKGIESLIEVKQTLGITGAFKDQIKSEITYNKRAEIIYFSLFIITLLLIPALIGGVYFIPELRGLNWEDLLVIKISIIIPLIWVARWFSKNYAHARLASIKFDHLNRLLGEGANTIAKLVEADTTAKAEVYKRFAELFLDIKDLESIAIKQPKHPIEDIKEFIDISKRFSD